jgi:hypothetical protein
MPGWETVRSPARANGPSGRNRRVKFTQQRRCLFRIAPV